MYIVHFKRLGAVAAAAGVLTVACSDGQGLGPDDDLARVRVTIQQAAPTSIDLAVAAGPDAAPMGPVPRELIGSLSVTVTSISVHRKADDTDGAPANGNPENGDGEWLMLELPDPTPLDLTALPSEGESPLVIAAGSVPAGDYNQVRLYIEGGSVVFTEAYSVGNAYTFDAAQEYPIEVPSSMTSGIKTDLQFVVAAGDREPQDIGLLFDSDATYRNVIGTGNGRVIVPPVLRAKRGITSEDGSGSS